MSKNLKQSSSQLASTAAGVLNDQKTSKTAKSLAGSVLAQCGTAKQTGAEMEDLASKVLKSTKYKDDTKSLAASVLSQSNKNR